MAFVSSNPWDAFGAASFGFQVFWLNRNQRAGRIRPAQCGDRACRPGDLARPAGVTPAARIAAAIDLLEAIETARGKPADAVANDFFRARRFIGGGDRRAVSERVWRVLRTRRRLGWWLREEKTPPPLVGGGGAILARANDPANSAPPPLEGGGGGRGAYGRGPRLYATPPPHPLPQGEGEPSPPATTRRPAASPRLLVAASLLLEGWALDGIASAFSGGRFAPAPLSPAELAALRRLEGHTLDHRGMPDAVRLEIPDWLFPRLAERFGAALEAEMAALLQPAPLDLRVNLLKTTREAAQAALAAEGLRRRADPLLALGPAHRRPPPGHHRRRLPAPAWWKSRTRAASSSPPWLGARPGMRVCRLVRRRRRQDAGAGGDHGEPRPDRRLRRLRRRGWTTPVRRLRRAGVHNVERHLLEPGDKWAKRRAGTFDRVLVDAPCTGTGTWRRNPDARLRLTETDLAELTARQAAILDAAAPLVRKGGRLVYATCSLLEEENEAQVMHFLARHPGFSPGAAGPRLAVRRSAALRPAISWR